VGCACASQYAFRWFAQRLFHLDRIYDAVAKWSETTELVAPGRTPRGPMR
jgi:hypothetical protein